ncbi:glycosyltransferase family 4 protein [Natranaeroarchaeum sulfidigenes]|uniref:Glycosyltransferase n=1 Tax=Natranaeroarchaeum sulfidigenes TaxID=2784880 RepID=A0A897MQM4_9EURY|nr:glycosyltransferase family 4 protein [Natranaeroarchaeum sulfidigenes]QSG01289.1 Glycosyltransferase [Natranaeroarchaeum sulfidigenes]
MSETTMHVGLVIYGDLNATSGGFRYDRQLVSYLREQGDTVDVISLPWRSYPRGLVDGVSPSIRAKLDRSVDVLVQDGLCHPSLWRQNHQLEKPGAIVTLIHHLRSDDPTERFGPTFRPFERRYLESVDAAISTSQFSRTRACELAAELGRKPTLVAPPAGRTEGAAVTPERVRKRAVTGPLRVVYLGNVVPRKDPKTLLAAIARGHPERDWELTVVGSHDADPDYAASVVMAASEYGIDDRVEFTGKIEPPGLEAILERSHVCCVPSRYEAFGMVYLEAMEYGVVPIAGSVGGAGEFVEHGHNGFVVEPGDEAGITTHLQELDDQRGRLAQLGKRALVTARQHPTWDESMSDIRAFLGKQSDGEQDV